MNMFGESTCLEQGNGGKEGPKPETNMSAANRFTAEDFMQGEKKQKFSSV